MKKLVLSALVLVLIFALVGTATETRVMTLGNANNIVKDEANILLYPSTINFYRNIVLGEFDSGGLYRVGGHYDFGEDKGVVGLYLDQMGLGIDPMYMPDPGLDGMVDNRLNLFYGRPFGDILFGMGFSLYSESYTSEMTGDDTEESNMGLGLQLGLTLMEERLDIAAGFDFGTWTYVDAAGDDVTEPESNMTINLGGRYWHEFNEEVYFVPHLGFVYDMGGYTDVPLDVTTEWTEMMFDVGFGVNIMPDDNVLFLFDFGIMYDTFTLDVAGTEATTSYMQLPYFKVGLEGYVTSWWDVRLGAVKYWESVSIDDVSSMGFASTSTYLGTGFHFGDLDIDVYLDESFATWGPNFVSNYTGPLAMMTSVKYNLP